METEKALFMCHIARKACSFYALLHSFGKYIGISAQVKTDFDILYRRQYQINSVNSSSKMVDSPALDSAGQGAGPSSLYHALPRKVGPHDP